MPRHSKHKKAKRPWYVPKVKAQKTVSQDIFAFALKYGWDVRPGVLGIWWLGRGSTRISLSFNETGDILIDAVLVRLDKPDRKLNLKQIKRVIAMLGELQPK